MKLSKRQKVCCVILALALGVLIVDRAIFYPEGGPAKASADSTQAQDERVAAATEYPDIQPSTAKLIQQLEKLCPDDNLDFNQVRDAFSLPASWLAEVGLGNHPGFEQSTTDRFAQSHQLKAVVVDGQSRYVLVDDHFLVIGQELDGFRLVAVDEDSATFAAGGKPVVLRLANDR
jgi:hypothetical protein